MCVCVHIYVHIYVYVYVYIYMTHAKGMFNSLLRGTGRMIRLVQKIIGTREAFIVIERKNIAI